MRRGEGRPEAGPWGDVSRSPVLPLSCSQQLFVSPILPETRVTLSFARCPAKQDLLWLAQVHRRGSLGAERPPRPLPTLAQPTSPTSCPAPVLVGCSWSHLDQGSWRGLNPGAEQTSEKCDSSCLSAKKGKVCVASEFPEKFSQGMESSVTRRPAPAWEGALWWLPCACPLGGRFPQGRVCWRNYYYLGKAKEKIPEESPFPWWITESTRPLWASWGDDPAAQASKRRCQ